VQGAHRDAGQRGDLSHVHRVPLLMTTTSVRPDVASGSSSFPDGRR
jgi:hypothetical protein